GKKGTKGPKGSGGKHHDESTEETTTPKGAGKKGSGSKGSHESTEETTTPKGAGKKGTKGNHESTEETTAKGAGKKGSGSKGSHESTEETTPKGAGKKGSGSKGNQASTEETTTLKGAGKSKGPGTKGNHEGTEETTTPKGAGKKGPGSKGSHERTEETTTPKGAGKKGPGSNGSHESTEETTPKGAGKKGTTGHKGWNSTESHEGTEETTPKRPRNNNRLTEELLHNVEQEAKELNASNSIDSSTWDDWQSYLKYWQHNIHDMTHKPDDYVPADFEDPLVILPNYVLASLKNMEAKQPRLLKLRIEKIRGLATMFDSFLRWQALNHPNFKHSWGEKPAMQLTQHCHFLQDVISGREEADEDQDDDDDEGEEVEEEQGEEDDWGVDQEEQHEDQDAEWYDEEEDADHDDEGEWGDDNGENEQEDPDYTALKSVDVNDAAWYADHCKQWNYKKADSWSGKPCKPACVHRPPKSILKRQLSSVTVNSEYSEPSTMSPLGLREQGQSKVSRARSLDMTHPNQMSAEERKRQRSAMMRRFNNPEGLLEKWENTSTTLGISEKRNEGHYVELPLHELRQKYSTPEGAAFLENEIVAKQPGRPHPQAPKNEDFRLYKVYECDREISAGIKRLSTAVKGQKKIKSAAAGQKLAETLAAQTVDLQKAGEPGSAKPPKKEKESKVLTPEEQEKKDFDKNMQQTLGNNIGT
ncbi:unnamed protein product, partial [Symbiodinium sp. CCMP2592]